MMRQVAANSWAPYLRAGDRALIALHEAWGDTLRAFWEGVAAQRVVLP
jgi:hypothetical protein